MLENIRGTLFDLDGVIVDTARYHYLAWKRLANELGFDFTQSYNERLKGVSRMQSLEILLEIGGITADEEEKLALAQKKNNWYVEYISSINPSEILKGAREYITRIKTAGSKVALGSASKNARRILENLNITELFDVIIDGNKTSKAKPDPEVFLLGARELGLDPVDCVVFEDAEAGIEAAKRAGMRVVGIGNSEVLRKADVVVAGLYELL